MNEGGRAPVPELVCEDSVRPCKLSVNLTEARASRPVTNLTATFSTLHLI
jgi:hypothetical protein